MWALFDTHYRGINNEVFQRDVTAKENAILLYDREGLIGFTSLGQTTVAGKRVTYSGDIIIAPDYRDVGTAQLFHAWAQAVWQEFDWWCLLCSGPRTYRIAHTFYSRVMPSPLENESPAEQAFRDQVARTIYGQQYDAVRGIVYLDQPYVMREPLTGLRADYPYFSQFRSLNPGWEQGDELVSMISLAPENWKPVARRMLNWKQGGRI